MHYQILDSVKVIESEFKECAMGVDCTNIPMPVTHTTIKTPSLSFIQEGVFPINGHAHQD